MLVTFTIVLGSLCLKLIVTVTGSYRGLCPGATLPAYAGSGFVTLPITCPILNLCLPTRVRVSRGCPTDLMPHLGQGPAMLEPTFLLLGSCWSTFDVSTSRSLGPGCEGRLVVPGLKCISQPSRSVIRPPFIRLLFQAAYGADLPISNCSNHLESLFLIIITSLMGPNIHCIQSLNLCDTVELL